MVFAKRLLILSILAYSFPTNAQQQDSAHAAFNNRLNQAIRSMTAGADSENTLLNTRIQTMNAYAPLDNGHLDSVTVGENVSRILEFISYLKHARASSDSLSQRFDDSLLIISNDIPPNINRSSISTLEESFHEDRDAFNHFLDAMDTLYSDVLDVLTGLQKASYTVKDKKLYFQTHEAERDYKKRIKIVDADVKELNTANEAMRAANAKANENLNKKQTTDQN